MVGSLVKPNFRQDPLAWDPEMDEATQRPPYMLMIDEYFTVYQHRRRRLVSGEAPEGVNGDRPMHAREWRAYQNRMNDEPAWERAERYRRMMQENGYRSIRAPFTEKRLRQVAMKKRSETSILREIQRVIQAKG